MNIFVAKLNFKTSSEELQRLFENFGEVSSAKVIFDSMTNRSKGYGFVEMPNDEEGERAINELNETVFAGNTIAVKQARPREENQQRGGFQRRNNNGNDRRFGGGGERRNRY
ncbi:MAG: RNA-binding protein [Lentimicrobiaceae bacterium]|jgi:RNA recognition motif-containing protein|nr:RNA-binding protein [Lentimicrobiaceae bacterium]